MMRVKSVKLLLTAGTLVLAASCGYTAGGEPGRDVASIDTASRPPTTAGTAGDEELRQAAQRYQQCLRDNGVTGGGMVDGKDETGPGGVTVDPSAAPPDPAGSDQLAEAQERCRHLLPNGGVMPTADPEVLDRQREWIRCLRDKGLEVTENSGGPPQVAVPNGDDEARRKVEECDRQVFGAAVPGGATVGGSR